MMGDIAKWSVNPNPNPNPNPKTNPNPNPTPNQVSVHCPQLELLNLTYCTALATLELRCPRLATLLCAGCKG